MAFTANDNTPLLFRRWTAYWVVAAAVQRKCWFVSLNKVIYPNLYVILCGPSAAGKGVALDPAARLLAGLNKKGESILQHVAPASVTSASLADELEDAVITFIAKDGTPYQYNALSIISRELGVFLPAYDGTMINTLTDLYDNKGYDERRRGKGKRLTIENAMLNFVAGTTPAYLNNTLPEGAWEEGFMSRSVVVYGSAMPPAEIVEEFEADAMTEGQLLRGLRDIANRSGRVYWSVPGLQHFNRWYKSGMLPQPNHPKLLTYNSRRHFNAMKLALVNCIARGGQKMEEQDVDAALLLLQDTEALMPEAFKAMKTGGDQEAVREVYHYCFTQYMKKKKGVPRYQLVALLQNLVPAYKVEQILTVMESARMIKPDGKGGYVPVRESVD
jgi:hypothetical protein